MARLPYPDPASLPEKPRTLFEGLPAKLNVFRMLLNAPTCLRGFLTLGTAVLAKQTLGARLRELAILRVATLSRADYEWTQHVAIAKACGATDADVAAVRAGDLGALDSKTALVIRFTDECVKDVRVSDATFEEARTSFPPREIAELTLAIGYYMMVARFLETLGVDAEPADPQMAAAFGRRSG